MPFLGEIKKGVNIGYKTRNNLIWTACIVCGKERWVTLRKGMPCKETCNCLKGRLGRLNKDWKGGQHKDNQRYIWVYLHPDDFFYPMANKRHYVLEHRLVMAKSLNRCLLPWEIVHHKNGIRDDNRIENLRLLKCRADHLPSMHVTLRINKLEKEIKELQGEVNQLRQRVILLEAENVILKVNSLVEIDKVK